MEITLEVIAGPHTGQTFTFNRPERFLVGRSPAAHFRFQPELEKEKDRLISRLHFLIEVNPPLCRLYDLGSRNKTYVNGTAVTSCDLAAGDEIQAGQSVLRVSIQEEPTAQDTTPWLGSPDAEAPGEALSAAPLVRFHPPPALPGDVCPACLTAKPARGKAICADCRRKAREVPQPVPGYYLLRLLGRGGLGSVSLALRRRDEQVVALKSILPPGKPLSGLIERFLREANLLRQLDHSHIVGFQEMGNTDGLIWFATDYIPGTDAARLLKERGRLPIRPAIRIVLQLLRALEYAHERKLVHWDIKPTNVLLETADDKLSVKVADFGLARIYHASQLSGLTLQNDLGGTLEFMPPEQFTHFRDVLPPADQFSAAALLYTLLTGQFIRDLSGPLASKIDQLLSNPPIPIRERRPELPAKLAEVIHRALDYDPSWRYPSVKEFRRALRAFAK